MEIYITTIDEFDEKGSNSGVLFDLADYADRDDFMEAVKAAFPDASDEDFTVSDWGDTPQTLISYFDDERLPDADEFAALKTAVEDENLEAFGEYIEWRGGFLNLDAYDAFETAYCGSFTSKRDFAEGELTDVPERLMEFFDLEKYEDALFAYDYKYFNGYVFRT